MLTEHSSMTPTGMKKQKVHIGWIVVPISIINSDSNIPIYMASTPGSKNYERIDITKEDYDDA